MAGPRLMAAIDLQDRMSSKLAQASNSVNRFEQQVNQTSRGLSSLERAADSAMTKLGGLAAGGIATGMALVTAKIIGIGTALYGIGKQALQTNMSFEKMAMTLDVMFKDHGKATDAFNWMLDFAAKTPFQVPELMQGVIQLQSRGLDYKKWLPLAGDLAAGAGTEMPMVLRAIGMMKSGVMGEAMETLRRAGISNDDFKKYGLNFNSQGQLKGGAKNTDKMMDALGKIIQDRFPNMMEKQSGTLQGIMSNIEDDMTRASIRVMGFDEKSMTWKNGSLFNMAKDAAKSVKGFVDELIDLPAISDQTMPLFDRLGAVWEFIEKKLRGWFEGGGKKKIAEIAGTLGETLATNMLQLFGIKVGEHTGILTEIGHTAGKAFWDGFKKAFDPTEIFKSDIAKGVTTAIAYALGSKIGGPKLGLALAGGTAAYAGFEGDAKNGKPASGWNMATLAAISGMGYFALRGKINPEVVGKLGKLGGIVPKWMTGGSKVVEEAVAHAPQLTRTVEAAAEGVGRTITSGGKAFTVKGLGDLGKGAAAEAQMLKSVVQAGKVAEQASGLSKFFKGAKGGLAIDIALGAADIALSEDKGKAVGRAIGSTTLGAIGAGLGSLIGPWGTLIGGWAGSVAGGWLGEHVVDAWRGRQETAKRRQEQTAMIQSNISKYGIDMTANQLMSPAYMNAAKAGMRPGSDRMPAASGDFKGYAPTPDSHGVTRSDMQNWLGTGDKMNTPMLGPAVPDPAFDQQASIMPFDIMPVELAPDVTQALLSMAQELAKSNMMQPQPPSITIPKLADQLIVREEADIDKISNSLVTKLQEQWSNMGQTNLVTP